MDIRNSGDRLRSAWNRENVFAARTCSVEIEILHQEEKGKSDEKVDSPTDYDRISELEQSTCGGAASSGLE
jgi:hypothetical protein